MRILSVGGGSGGHVTPVVAVLDELKKRDKNATMRFWCDKKFGTQAKRIMHEFDPELRVDTIVAGKLRRYHHLSIWQHLLTPSVVFPNLIDMVKVFTGCAQAFFKLLAWRPDVIFLKGGYVCLPVGWAARVLNIPFVIHDSDAHPGLTNRLLAPYARHIATGAPLEYYTYPAKRSTYVGIPISEDFRTLLPEERAQIKAERGFAQDKPLVVVTGGGLGAKRINDAVIDNVDKITTFASLLLISGVGQYDELRAKIGEDRPEFQLKSFISTGMAQIIGAADVVVARSGATSIVELAAVSAPTILVPNGRLTGGHQLKNTKVYQDAGAVKVADEEVFKDDAGVLIDAIKELATDTKTQEQLRIAFHEFAKPQAARDMAEIVLNASKKSSS